jgi:multidrug efflux pump subunit AcrA (membrane-fusion protein)
MSSIDPRATNRAQNVTIYDIHQSSQSRDRKDAAMSSSSTPASSLSRPLPRVLAALAAVLLLAGCEAQTAPALKVERPVKVQRVAFEDANSKREFVGVVRARYETDLGFRVAGKIVTRIVNVGDRVQVGDVVARLDPEDLRLQV